MKLTKSKLKQIIKEELSQVLDEQIPNPEFRRRAALKDTKKNAEQELLDIFSVPAISGETARDWYILKNSVEEYVNFAVDEKGQTGVNAKDFIEWRFPTTSRRPLTARGAAEKALYQRTLQSHHDDPKRTKGDA